MDLVQLVNSADEVIGVLEKKAAHLGEGKLHRAASVFLFNTAGELLIQQRSSKKITAPYKWANTCCGNVLPDESYEDCAKRRLQVELGITGVRLARLGKFEYKTRIDDTYSEHEIDTVFIAHAKVDPAPNPEEVARVRWVSWQEFLDMLRVDTREIAPWVPIIVEHFSPLFSFPFDLGRASTSNCENLVGSVQVPVGTVGPVTVISNVLSGDIMLPLATTEGALVASTARGVKALNISGGVQGYVHRVGISRAPVFLCRDGRSAREFVEWLQDHQSWVAKITESTSSHLRFKRLDSWVRGRLVYIRFVFDSGEAMGMNMVSIALAVLVERLGEQFQDIQCLSLSSNLCTDKKDAGINQLLGRGYSVQVEARITDRVLDEILHTDRDQLVATFEAKCHVGSTLALSFSQNMQVANVLSAMYLATGQDLAHVVDGSNAMLIVEKIEEGVFVSLSLPSLIVGVLGGGTWFPAQAKARELIAKDLTSEQLALAIAAGCLAAEISGLSALSTNTLAAAHATLGRVQRSTAL